MKNLMYEQSLEGLCELYTKTPEQIALFLCRHSFNIDTYLKQKNNQSVIYQLVLCIEKGLQSNSMSASLNELFLRSFGQSEFLQIHVYELLAQKPANLNEYLKFVRSVLNVCYLSLIINPQMTKDLDTILERLDFLIKYRLNDSVLLNEYKRGLCHLCDSLKKKFNYMRADRIEQDFTQMSIVPRVADILSNKPPVLRKNIINGPFSSVKDYLDIQFKLLREDFCIRSDQVWQSLEK